MKIIRGEKGFKRRGIKFFVDIFFFPSRINIKRLSLINKIRMENGETKERGICVYFGSMNMNIVKSRIFDGDAK